MTTVTQNPVNSFVRRDQTLDHLRVTTQLDVPLLNVATVNTATGPNQPLGSIFYDVATGVLYISQGSAATNLVPSSVAAAYFYGSGLSAVLNAGAGIALATPSPSPANTTLAINTVATPAEFPSIIKSANITAGAGFVTSETGTYLVDFRGDLAFTYTSAAVPADTLDFAVQLSTTSASAGFQNIGDFKYALAVSSTNAVTLQFPIRGQAYIALPTAAPSSTIWLQLVVTLGSGGTAAHVTGITLVSTNLRISRVV
jgi:hypothetical protein